MTEDGSTGKALKYWYSDPSVVTTVTKEITMPECEISFSLENKSMILYLIYEFGKTTMRINHIGLVFYIDFLKDSFIILALINLKGFSTVLSTVLSTIPCCRFKSSLDACSRASEAEKIK